ncbi:Protein kinase [Aphelenchoides avenae]|nr:Protein kinase [Aphelenchus avenae]
MSLAKVPPLFKCVQCGKEYNKRSSWQSHMETHGGKLHECDRCEKKYKRRQELLRHKRTAHAEPGQFECDECGKICPQKHALKNHKRGAHPAFECPVCGKKVRRSNASHHMETHIGQPCECDVCGSTHRNPLALVQHKKYAHSKATHQCEHCGKTFGRACDLQRHVATHDERRKEYRCVRCPRTFKTLKGRENHVGIEHSGNIFSVPLDIHRTILVDYRFTCDTGCGLNSATRSQYLEHLRSQHAKQHPATCKCVSIDVMLAQQVAMKLGNTAFVEAAGTLKCNDGACDFTTTCARQMESHKEQCHRDVYLPTLRCSSCDTWFSEPWSLKRHNADKHQGERRFKCVKCGYVTNYKAYFNKHQTSCEEGRAVGNRKLKRAEPTTEMLDAKKDSPHGVYRFESQIGEGGFGTVYKAVKKGQHLAVKYAIKEVGPNGGKSAELEAKLMRQFEHKASAAFVSGNLMTLLEYYECEEKGRLTRFIVMEYCRPGSLTSMQKLAQFQFEEPHVLYVLKEVTCGLERLHFAGVIHRDLKSANVLVNERAEVKISDFGVSTDERIA